MKKNKAEWKPKCKTSNDSKSEVKVSSAVDVIKKFRKRFRSVDQDEVKNQIKIKKDEISKLGDERHLIRKKRLLKQEILNLEKKLVEESPGEEFNLEDVLKKKNSVTRKKIKRSFNDETRRRPSSHSRVIKVSREKIDIDGDKDMILEDMVAHIKDKNYVPPVYVSFNGTCPECNSMMQKLPTEASMACGECGISVPYLDSTTRSANHGDDRSYPSFSYKKINHFRDWLRSVQAKESTNISQDILDMVCTKCQEQRLSPDDLTPKKIREILKQCKLRKYYENAVLIHSLMTGKQPPRFQPETEYQLEQMFMQIALPFEIAVKEVAPERKNFLSYAFVCFKFVQLLPDVDNRWLQSFGLLKGRDKLYKQDQIWRHICNQLGWKFHPSV